MLLDKSRHGNRWTVNECLQLQREFELLELSIDEIAYRHKRTPNAIMNKLDSEGFADYNVLCSKYNDLNRHIPTHSKHVDVDEEEDDEDDDDEYSDYTPEEEDDTEDDEDDEDDEEDDEEDEDEDEYSAKVNLADSDYTSEKEEEEDNDIKSQVNRLEKQIMALTEMFMKQSKNNKSMFSLFA